MISPAMISPGMSRVPAGPKRFLAASPATATVTPPVLVFATTPPTAE